MSGAKLSCFRSSPSFHLHLLVGNRGQTLSGNSNVSMVMHPVLSNMWWSRWVARPSIFCMPLFVYGLVRCCGRFTSSCTWSGLELDLPSPCHIFVWRKHFHPCLTSVSNIYVYTTYGRNVTRENKTNITILTLSFLVLLSKRSDLVSCRCVTSKTRGSTDCFSFGSGRELVTNYKGCVLCFDHFNALFCLSFALFYLSFLLL